MKVGFVGNGSDKFTDRGRTAALALIESLVRSNGSPTIVSGRSPVGGIDVWAEQYALESGLPTEIFVPEIHQWNPKGYGYKARNLDIARNSEELHVIVAASYPVAYTGRRFKVCYHCARNGGTTDHVKSGGCWTGYKARGFGNKATWHIIEN